MSWFEKNLFNNSFKETSVCLKYSGRCRCYILRHLFADCCSPVNETATQACKFFCWRNAGFALWKPLGLYLAPCLSFSYCLWFPGDHIAGMLAVSVASSRTLEVLDLEGTGLTNQSAQVYSKLRTTSGNMGIFEYIYSNKLLYTHTHTHTQYIYIYIYIYIYTGVKSTWNHSWVKVQIPYSENYSTTCYKSPIPKQLE